MIPEPRVRLAARQAELVRALYGGPSAPGLDRGMAPINSGRPDEERAPGVGSDLPALPPGPARPERRAGRPSQALAAPVPSQAMATSARLPVRALAGL